MITVVGLGPGNPGYLTVKGYSLLESADIIIGSSRQLQEVPATTSAKQMVLPKKLDELEQFLRQHIMKDLVLLASGDPLLYGIGKWVLERFRPEEVTIISGISSIQYICAKAGISMNDLYISSSHGKVPDFDFLLAHSKVAMVTDKKIGPYEIAVEITKRNLRKRMIIGENVSYPNEKIYRLSPIEVEKNYNMNVVVIEDER
ncbi:cobalt-precorrin-7 (C(5))-methyltransferase [Bacillus massiliigorillae]|uniref:cobalt-precorrin-7 (C(5))-methyltransferase n=1 Tax=Bacillus massiliigorillae TaxID=1243664 RepID=UPI00039D70F5|nr:cobalt-precorrin-7 (C(5))-methyltransferase [Bacillus massiliigorillae]